jgi:hypothetical protein
VIAGLGIDHRHQRHHPGGTHEHGVAVGRLAHDVFAREPAAAAGLVLDHHRLAQKLTDLVAHESREDVVAAAGRISHHEADRLVRKACADIPLCRRAPAGARREHGEHRKRREEAKASHGPLAY